MAFTLKFKTRRKYKIAVSKLDHLVQFLNHYMKTKLFVCYSDTIENLHHSAARLILHHWDIGPGCYTDSHRMLNPAKNLFPTTKNRSRHTSCEIQLKDSY